MDNEQAACDLAEDFDYGNLHYLQVENTFEALTAWLDANTNYNPCPDCLQSLDYDDTLIDPHAHLILMQVDRRRLVQLLREMVAIPSLTFEEQRLAAYLADCMSKMGLEVELQTITETDGAGRTSQQPIARWHGRAEGPTFLLTSHMDHEPPAEGWDGSPFEGRRDGGWFYGCAVQDGKGSIAAMLMAIAALRADQGTSLKGNVILAPLMGSKQANLGIHHLLDGGLRADWAIDLQNTNLQIVTVPGPSDEHQVRTLRKWHKRIQRRNALIAGGAAPAEDADGAVLARAGIPSVLYGPGDRSAFAQWPAANERIWVDDLMTAAGIIALTVSDLLNGR